ncbi:MAG: M48 family peptidase, partial [Proteobacteria bacterium]|nr:M48 family peptidase [Pseudomonadota bacterium]
MKKIIIAALIFSSMLKTAENIKLPDLGTPAEEAMSLNEEADYRDDVLQQMHQYHFLMTDPIVASYMYHLGYRLASNSGNPEREFYFFMVPYNIINAAAYPG